MRIVLTGSVMGFMLAASLGVAGTGLPERPDMYDRIGLEEYRRGLYRAYMTCSNAAVDRILSHGEVSACSTVYMKLKLSFLHGVTMERYMAMKPKTKKVALEKGYHAYLAWRHRHLAMAAN